MSFPAYPEYKPSGLDWLEGVPAHWQNRKIARDLPFVVGWTPSSGRDEYYDGDLPWVTIADMTQKFVKDTKSKISRLAVQERGAKVVPAGSMLFSFKLTVGKVAFLATDSYTNEAIAGFFPGGKFDLEYWKYAAAEFIPRYGRENIYGATLLNQELIGSVRFYAPAQAEQTQIARFLNHETARIDALIEEQQRLIELLKEKRQAVISHAVTKGLDHTAPMKESGVEWLGEVPAHWVVCTARRVIRLIEQGWSPECESYPAEEDGWGVLKAGCVNGGFFDASENKTLPSTLKPIPEYEVRAGDILMSRASGSPELVGSTALLGQVRERLMLSDKIFRIHLEEKVSSQFFVWVMNSQFMRSQIEQALSGGNGLANNLPQSSLLAFWLAMPPEHEQGAIAELISKQIGRIDELVVEGEAAVELLQERRSALISAAVTGKIDVRGWQPPASFTSPELAQEAV